MDRCKKKQTVFCIQEGRIVRKRINSLIEVTAKHMKHFEMPCTSGVCGRQKSEILDGVSVFVCVCVCVCVCPSQCRFTSPSVQEVLSCLCIIHMKQRPWDETDTFL